MFRRALIILALVIGVLVGERAAHAGVYGNAVIDWSKLTIDLQDLSGGTNSPVLEWTSRYGYISAESVTRDPFDYQIDEGEAFDSVADLDGMASTLQAQSRAKRVSTELSAYAATQPANTLVVGDYNRAQAYSLSEAEFTFTGHGLLIVTVPWTLAVTGAAGDWDNFTYADVWIQGTYTDGLYGDGEATSGWSLRSTMDGDAEASGTFSMAIINPGLGGTITGSFKADAYAESFSWNEVPEPSTCVLMVVGFCCAGGFTAWRRRK